MHIWSCRIASAYRHIAKPGQQTTAPMQKRRSMQGPGTRHQHHPMLAPARFVNGKQLRHGHGLQSLVVVTICLSLSEWMDRVVSLRAEPSPAEPLCGWLLGAMTTIGSVHRCCLKFRHACLHPLSVFPERGRALQSSGPRHVWTGSLETCKISGCKWYGCYWSVFEFDSSRKKLESNSFSSLAIPYLYPVYICIFKVGCPF